MALEQMNYVRRCLPPHVRQCSNLGVECNQPVTQVLLHPTLRVQLDSLIQPEEQTRLRDTSSTPSVEVELESLPRKQYRAEEWRDTRGDEGDEVLDDNTKEILRSLGRQGMVTKSYDGSGGMLVLQMWNDSLAKHFRIQGVREGLNQVTIAACFLVGRAREWWERAYMTGTTARSDNPVGIDKSPPAAVPTPQRRVQTRPAMEGFGAKGRNRQLPTRGVPTTWTTPARRNRGVPSHLPRIKEGGARSHHAGAETEGQKTSTSCSGV